MMIHTVAIVEDDKKYSDMLKKVIDSSATLLCVVQYYNAEEAEQGLKETDLDYILMDIQLPDKSGIEVIQALKPHLPKSKFIMCSSFEDDEKIFQSLRAGACGYLIKGDSPEKILELLSDVQSGGAPMSATIAKKIIQSFNMQGEQRLKLDELSDRENEVLDLLSKGFLYKEISTQLKLALDTVKKHAGSIYRKLQVNNRTEAINMYLSRHS